MIHANRQRVFLADIAAVFIDHCQAVGIRILAKTDVALGFGNLRQHARQIRSRWLGRVRRNAPGFPFRSKCFGNSASTTTTRQEIDRNRRWNRSARGIVVCDPLAINNCHYQIDVRVFELQLERVTDCAYRVYYQLGIISPIPLQYFVPGRCRNDSPCGRKQLQPVVFDRIMAGRNLNSRRLHDDALLMALR